MARKTNYIASNKNQAWFEWCKSLIELYTTDKHFAYDKIHKSSSLQMRRWILGHEFDGVQKLLRNLLLDAMISADQQSHGAGMYVPWFIYNRDVYSVPTRSSSGTYLEATLSKTSDNTAKDCFRSIHAHAVPLTKIVVKKSYESDIVIKYRNAFRFNLPLDPQFHRIIGHVETIEQTNPNIIMIEGSPETAAEINSILQWNNQSGRPVVLIARSFPEEVSATLATNWLRGSLSILPIPYGNAMDSINLAADMCAISKGELISPHFGDVISAALLDEDKWGSVDRLEWHNNGLSLFKEVNVDGHIRNIVEKMKSIEEEEIQNMYRDRILALSNDALEVWIPKDNTHLHNELDGLIKHYNGFVTSGLVDTEIGPVPKCFVDSAKESACSLRKEILNIGGFLVGVDNEKVVVGQR